MNKLIIAVLLAGVAVNTYAKEVAQFTNKNGGLTVLTDAACPVDDDYLYGVATGAKVATQSFCWTVSGEDVILYLPLNKSVKVPLKEFEKPNGKTPKPYSVL